VTAREAEVTHSMNRSRLGHKIWALLTRRERRGALVLLGMMIVGMALETLGIGLVVPAIAVLTDPAMAERSPRLRQMLDAAGIGDREALVTWAMTGLVAIYLVKAAFLALLAWHQTRFVFGVQANLSQRLFTMYLRLPYTFHLQRNSAQLIRNAVNEVNMFTFHAMMAGLTLLAEGLVLIGLGVLLLVLEPVGALVVFGVLGAASWGSLALTRGSLLRWGKARQHHEGLRIQHLQQGLGGVKDVKLLGRERDFIDQYGIHNRQSARAGELQLTLQQLPRLWLELLAVLGLAVLVFTMMGQGRKVMTILPTLGLFAAAAFRLMPSANRVLGALQSLRFGLPAINTLYEEIGFEKPAVAAAASAGQAFRERVELDRVSYTYEGAATPALEDISIEIRRGESVGIIGTSGAGKSTLVDVLLGLLTPSNGEVRVDGVSIRSGLRAWQNQVGYVPQSIFLTDDSLRHNIAFGLPREQIDEAAVRRAVRAAQLEEFVAGLPEGLETLVGERGVRLSGGQRQRIGIARALYHDPAVLVLDEATSSLDIATETEFMQSIGELRGAKTIVIVAHRLATVANCTRLYRLEQGRVAESGPPQAVLAHAH
jgi:ATP-binding cassette, subfamily B, bacterial PglK